MTPLSEDTEEKIYPCGCSHRPFCSALSADSGDRGWGGILTALTVRCSHHGYTGHISVCRCILPQGTKAGGAEPLSCWDTTGSRFYYVLCLQAVRTLFITVWINEQFLFPHRQLQSAGLKRLLISGLVTELRHNPPSEHTLAFKAANGM